MTTPSDGDSHFDCPEAQIVRAELAIAQRALAEPKRSVVIIDTKNQPQMSMVQRWKKALQAKFK